MKIALYMRVSQEDRVGWGATAANESASLSNQRLLLREYAKSNFSGSEIIEFSDDGYSGTNFNRPGIKQLLRMAGKKEIDCVIVKDFSRFGRDFIEVSRYLENVFPFKEVRFISVNDGYDSLTANSEDLSVPLQNLIYSLYSKDLSKKVSSGVRAKMLRGEFAGSSAPYGYKRDNSGGSKLVIDVNTAPVVRRIFDMLLDCGKPSEIAELLNSEGILSPARYKSEITKERTYKALKYSWNNYAVLRILRDARYTGAAVSGKRKRLRVGNPDTIPCREEEIVVLEGAHEGIVTKEQFEKAQKLLTKRGSNSTGRRVKGVLYRKLRCGGCGRCLIKRKTKASYYTCGQAKANAGKCCFKGRLEERVVLDIISKSVEAYEGIVLDNESQKKLCRSVKGGLQVNELVDVKKHIDKVKREKLKRYEEFISGKLCKEEYLTKKQLCHNKIKELETEVLKRERLKLASDSRESLDMIFSLLKIRVFTAQISETLLQNIYVHSDSRLEIIWDFNDFFDG